MCLQTVTVLLMQSAGVHGVCIRQRQQYVPKVPRAALRADVLNVQDQCVTTNQQKDSGEPHCIHIWISSQRLLKEADHF